MESGADSGKHLIYRSYALENKPPIDLRQSYFNSLREEILNTRGRIYRALMLGIIGSPVLTYFALKEDTHVMVLLLSPLMILMVLVLYLSEQASMMQAGRFIKENIEQEEGDWEHWLSARRVHTSEPQLLGMFSIVCLVFYVILVCLAIQRVIHMKTNLNQEWFDLYMYDFWKYGIPLLYVVATLWTLVTLLRFWRSALKT